MNRLKILLGEIILFCLISCQSEPEIFFENINVGDNLETCLAKGTIQHNPDYNVETIAPNFKNMFELANSNIADSNFSYTGVWFDENNVVKEIELTFHQKNTGKTAKEVFNYMTQYFCKRYHRMATSDVSEIWKTDSYDLEYKKKGVQNVWETNKLKIILQSYDNLRIDSPYAENGQNWSLYSSVREDMAQRYYDGSWVRLNITAK